MRIQTRQNFLMICGGGASTTDLLHTSTADTDASADLLGVQVVVHDTLDDGRQLGFNKGVAGGDKVGQDSSHGSANLNVKRT